MNICHFFIITKEPFFSQIQNMNLLLSCQIYCIFVCDRFLTLMHDSYKIFLVNYRKSCCILIRISNVELAINVWISFVCVGGILLTEFKNISYNYPLVQKGNLQPLDRVYMRGLVLQSLFPGLCFPFLCSLQFGRAKELVVCTKTSHGNCVFYLSFFLFCLLKSHFYRLEAALTLTTFITKLYVKTNCFETVMSLLYCCLLLLKGIPELRGVQYLLCQDIQFV